MSEPPDSTASRRTLLRSVAFLVAALAALFVLGRWGGRYMPAFVAHIRSYGALGPLVYVLGYMIAMVAGIPAALLTLAAGAVFGLWAGILWAFVGATLGASTAFLVSRYVARGLVEKRVASEPRFAAIDRAIAADGRRIVFLLRLSPAVPFTLMNYLLGLTQVRFVDFVMGSAGILPATIMYVYSGKVAGDVAAATSGTGPVHGMGYYTVIALGLLATVAVTVLVTRTARRALRESVGDPPDSHNAGALPDAGASRNSHSSAPRHR